MDGKFWLILIILLGLAATFAAGCKIFSDRKVPSKVIVAENVQLSEKWLEISPTPPLKANAQIHFIGLKLNNSQGNVVTGYANDDNTKLRLDNGGELVIHIELINENGESISLYPNGIGEYVEFGKRTVNNVPNSSYFLPGEKFTKLRLQSDKELQISEIVWAEFEF